MARLQVSTVTLSASDPVRLARFYGALLGWEVAREDDDWVVARDPDGGVGVACQRQTAFERPVWPGGAGQQQMQVHLEVAVDDLDGAVAHALSVGAEVAAHQPQDDVRVCLDPDGHPFCLWLDEGMLGAGAGEG